jgi:hypothetical protein
VTFGKTPTLACPKSRALGRGWPGSGAADLYFDLGRATVEGKVIGIKTAEVRPLSRATQGVRIISLEAKDRVSAIAKVLES